MQVTTIVILGLTSVVLFNFAFYKYVVRIAATKYIEPMMSEEGFELDGVKFVGVFGKGDFENEPSNFLPIFTEGFPVNHTYVFVFFKKKNEAQPRRTTAKIRTLFFIIKNITFKPDI